MLKSTLNKSIQTGSKNIKVDRHFIKEKLNSGIICMQFVSTKDQVTDVFTNGQPNNVFQDLIRARNRRYPLTSLRGSVGL